MNFPAITFLNSFSSTASFSCFFKLSFLPILFNSLLRHYSSLYISASRGFPNHTKSDQMLPVYTPRKSWVCKRTYQSDSLDPSGDTKSAQFIRRKGGHALERHVRRPKALKLVRNHPAGSIESATPHSCLQSRCSGSDAWRRLQTTAICTSYNRLK